MSITEYKCRHCKSHLEEENGIYICHSCGRKYKLKASVTKSNKQGTTTASAILKGKTTWVKEANKNIDKAASPAKDTQNEYTTVPPKEKKEKKYSAFIRYGIKAISLFALISATTLIIGFVIDLKINTALETIRNEIATESSNADLSEKEIKEKLQQYETLLDEIENKTKNIDGINDAQDEQSEEINNLKQKIDELQNILNDLQTKKEADKAKQTEVAKTEKEQSTTSVVSYPFKDSVYNSLSNEQKQKAIQLLLQLIAKDLQIQVPAITWESQSLDVAARYSPSRKTIIVNPNVSLTGSALADVLIHEMRHAYQYSHINDGTDYANTIKANDANYISLSTDFNEYLNQPIEADAISYVGTFQSKYGLVSNLKLSLETDVASAK